MHKATEGVGGACFSAPHTCLAHSDRAGQTQAAMGQCMKACSWVSSTPQSSHGALHEGMFMGAKHTTGWAFVLA